MVVVVTVTEVYSISNKKQLSNRSVKHLLVHTKDPTYLLHFQTKLTLSIPETPRNIMFYIFFAGFENGSGVYNYKEIPVSQLGSKKLIFSPKRLYISFLFSRATVGFHQKRIRDPVEHLRWIFLQKYLTAKKG